VLVWVDDNVMEVPVDMCWAFTDGDYYEKNVTHWLAELLATSKGKVLYDVGANYGYYCLKLARIATQVYAFEPVRVSYRVLMENVRRNGLKNVKAYRVALGERDATTRMHIFTSSGNNSLFEIQFPRYHPARIVGGEHVDIVRLDGLVATDKLKPPDVMKIDIEGGELRALIGARQTIRKYRPAVVVEYLEPVCRAAGYDRRELVHELEGHNYAIFGLADDVADLHAYPLHEVGDKEIGHIIGLPRDRAEHGPAHSGTMEVLKAVRDA
jgi:FkbM family methyltransferase